MLSVNGPAGRASKRLNLHARDAIMRLNPLNSTTIAVLAFQMLLCHLPAQQTDSSDERPTLRDRTQENPAQNAPSNAQPAIRDKTQSTAAQAAKPPGEVVLGVTVRDKKGNLVPNLTAADFMLTEDGRPQTIKSFAQQSDTPLLVGLAVDTSQAVLGATGAVRTASEKLLQSILPADAKQAKPGYQAFLLHFDNEVELLEDFTNSREKLMKELEQMRPTSMSRNNPRGPETRQDPNERSRPSYGGTQLYDAVFLASNELMKPKQGRKALIVFSTGVDRSSKETQSEAIDAAERADTTIYTVYFRGGEERQSGFGGMDRTGGMGYPGGGYPGGGGGYPGGGYPGGGYPGGGRRGGQEKAAIDGKKVMQDIANRTGGEFFEAKKSDNIADIYNEISTELQGQYVLVYTPDKADDEGGYHKISLTPKKDDLSVRTRPGYYGTGGDDR
jgi:VWFA-related protein